MEPIVSIVIPVYNCEKYIGRCLESVLGQTYSRLQIIVINDGSVDKSGEIIQSFAEKNSSILYLNRQNEGAAAARNDAVSKADGKYILFIDADDYVGRGYVESLVRRAEERMSELVICGFTMVDEEERIIQRTIPSIYVQNQKEEWAYRISAVCSRLYNREFWIRNNIRFIQEEGARPEDIPLAMYANVMAENIAIVQEAEYFYRQHSESAMHKNRGSFTFPYRAFEEYDKRVQIQGARNNKDFYYVGMLKALAQFEFIIYRNVSNEEKRRFMKYAIDLLKNRFVEVKAAWKKLRFNIEFPLLHKIAIELYLKKMTWQVRKLRV